MTPRCTDDPVWKNNGHSWLWRWDGSGLPLHNGLHTAGGEGGVGSISKLCNSKRQSLGPEWSMYEVGTSPSHESDIHHVLLASNTRHFNIIWYLYPT